MTSTIASVVFLIVIVFLSLKFYPSKANLIRAGYWDLTDNITSSDLAATLFTHLICHSAGINSTSYQLSLSPFGANEYSNFQEFVKQKNPSVTTLLSIGGKYVNDLTFSSMLNDSSYRKSFIDSSIKLARDYGFQGLDFFWEFSFASSNDMFNLGMLFQEWRVATELEAQKSNQSRLILTSRVGFSPQTASGTYPVEFMQRNLNWVHFFYGGFRNGSSTDITAAPVSLFDPSSTVLYTDFGIREWLNDGLSANKLVLCLPFYGYFWNLTNPEDSGLGKTATGPARSIRYNEIKSLINNHGSKVDVMYNSTYVVNYCLIGSTWIAFDDVESIKAKISYAKENSLLGYHAWQVSSDDNWVLSQAAAGRDDNDDDNNNNDSDSDSERLMLAIILPTAAAVILLTGFSIYYLWIRKLKFKGKDLGNYEQSVRANEAAAAEDLSSNAMNLVEYTYSNLEAATNGFSIENKLGEGGFGPVYKGVLPDGQEIAVKKLSKISMQGFEEFKNEVTLTSKLQHVNLVRVLGFCIDREEHLLIYEYMPNKSLDDYLFHPIRRLILSWEKRVHIIQGIIQGLLYLQVYSRFTIIHRDLKASNILLDEDMKPKISDFGIARAFVRENLEANTNHVVGTYGYVPPEYVKRGIYSPKSDVYSFGVLLLQIISGKRILVKENLSLLNYAYELWEDDKGIDFMDLSLDDTESSCKLMRCLQIALLCVQKNRNDRPSMLKVSSMLNNETANIDTPKKPAFSYQDDQNEPALQQEICSVNNVTISDMTLR